jgi:O-antigen/teichoic acid export membrane protein
VKAGKGGVAGSLLWKILEGYGTQGVTLLVSIVLARLISPEEYVFVALVMAVVNVANVLVQTGFGSALIQREDVTDADFSAVCALNLLVSALLYLVLFFAAPAVAAFYRMERLTGMLRLGGVSLFFGAVLSVENALCGRRMAFRALCLCAFGAAAISGALGVALAYMGFGAWALVVSNIVQNAGMMLLLGAALGWRPVRGLAGADGEAMEGPGWSPGMQLRRLGALFSFGWKLLCAGILDTVYTNVYELFIGKVFVPESLSYFNRANQFPRLVANNMGGVIQAVMLPVYSREQGNPDNVRAWVRKTVRTGAFISFPLMAGMAAAARPMVLVLLGANWEKTAGFLQLLCLGYAFWPLDTANLQAMNALGRSDLFLKLEIAKKVLGVAGLVLSVPFGVYGVVGVRTLIEVVCFALNAAPNRKLLGYGIGRQFADILAPVLCSLAMGAAVYALGAFGILRWGVAATFALQVAAGVAIYLALSVLWQRESLGAVWGALAQLLLRRQNLV